MEPYFREEKKTTTEENKLNSRKKAYKKSRKRKKHKYIMKEDPETASDQSEGTANPEKRKSCSRK